MGHLSSIWILGVLYCLLWAAYFPMYNWSFTTSDTQGFIILAGYWWTESELSWLEMWEGDSITHINVLWERRKMEGFLLLQRLHFLTRVRTCVFLFLLASQVHSNFRILSIWSDQSRNFSNSNSGIRDDEETGGVQTGLKQLASAGCACKDSEEIHLLDIDNR